MPLGYLGLSNPQPIAQNTLIEWFTCPEEVNLQTRFINVFSARAIDGHFTSRTEADLLFAIVHSTKRRKNLNILCTQVKITRLSYRLQKKCGRAFIKNKPQTHMNEFCPSLMPVLRQLVYAVARNIASSPTLIGLRTTFIPWRHEHVPTRSLLCSNSCSLYTITRSCHRLIYYTFSNQQTLGYLIVETVKQVIRQFCIILIS